MNRERTAEVDKREGHAMLTRAIRGKPSVLYSKRTAQAEENESKLCGQVTPFGVPNFCNGVMRLG